METYKNLGAKVAVLGGAGGIGQSFCLLLKQSPIVESLAIYDIVGAPGVACDLSHVNTRGSVKGYTPADDGLVHALTGADVVVITAGKAQAPGRSMEDLFAENAPIIRELTENIAKNCPKAVICVITNPINSLVPVVTQIMKKHGVLDTRKIFGVLSLNVMRASLFAANLKHQQLGQSYVPVIGGHSEKTTVPVFSQMRPGGIVFTDQEQENLTERVKHAIFEVINAKSGVGSATLSMAHAAYHFVHSLLEAMHGVPGIVECAYVRSDITEDKYFCNSLLLGPHGIEANLGTGPLNDLETRYLQEAVQQLKIDIKLGEDWAAENL